MSAGQAKPFTIVSLARAAIALLVCLLIGWQLIVTETASLEMSAGHAASALALDQTSPSAHDALALGALNAKHLTEAKIQAIAALSDAPIDQSALTVAAISGDPSHLPALLSLSAGLGWRDLATQVLLAQQGIRQGNAELFAQRFDAYQRQAGPTGSLLSLLDGYIGNPSVQSAIVQRLAADPNWRTPYLQGLPNPDPDLVTAREAILAQLARSTRPASREEIDAFVFRLHLYGMEADAYRIWRRFVAIPSSWSGLLYDGGFRHINDGASFVPYEWTTQNLSGAYASVESGTQASSLMLHSEGTSDGQLIKQTVRLTPGRYRFSVRATRDDGAARIEPSDFVVSIRCVGNVELIESSGGEGGAVHVGDNHFALTVPAGCDEPIVAVGAVSGSAGVPDDLSLTDARIDRTD